jgi:hypothetical protein
MVRTPFFKQNGFAGSRDTLFRVAHQASIAIDRLPPPSHNSARFFSAYLREIGSRICRAQPARLAEWWP